jgi:hypothetical protein
MHGPRRLTLQVAGAVTAASLVCLSAAACTAAGPGPGQVAAPTTSAQAAKSTISAQAAAPAISAQAATPTTSAQALCHVVLTPADLPAGFATTPLAPLDCQDPNNSGIDYGTNNSLQQVFEDLTLNANSAAAGANFNSYTAQIAAVFPGITEQSASAYSDLGDQVSYYAQNIEGTYWKYLFIRRGRLLMTVGVTSKGAFTTAQLRTLAQKAESRAHQFM